MGGREGEGGETSRAKEPHNELDAGLSPWYLAIEIICRDLSWHDDVET